MNNLKSIFVLFAITVGIATIILGSPVPALAQNYFCKDNKCVLENNCRHGTDWVCTYTQCEPDTGAIDCSFGKIDIPPGVKKYGSFCEGLMPFINNILRILFIIGGLYSFFNFIFAGLKFIHAGGDPKGIQSAWGRIWKSFMGLIILVSSFLIAAIIGLVVFGNVTAILKPVITGAPGAICQ